MSNGDRIFTWDDAKSDRCLEDRGFDFALASRVFEGDMLVAVDGRHDYGETRLRGIGRIDGRLFVVVFVERGDETRIISARRAREKEFDRWPR